MCSRTVLYSHRFYQPSSSKSVHPSNLEELLRVHDEHLPHQDSGETSTIQEPTQSNFARTPSYSTSALSQHRSNREFYTHDRPQWGYAHSTTPFSQQPVISRPRLQSDLGGDSAHFPASSFSFRGPNWTNNLVESRTSADRLPVGERPQSSQPSTRSSAPSRPSK